jgi:hypothetical protein
MFQEINGLRPQRAASPFVAFAVQPDAQGPVKIDISHAQVCNILNPSPAVVKEHKKRTITEGERTVLGECLEDGIDFLALQENSFGSWTAFGRNGLHSLSFGQYFGMVNGEISVKRGEGCKPLVSRGDMVSPLCFDYA